MINALPLLEEFYLSSKLSIFTYNQVGEQTAQFKQAVSPKFPNKLLSKINFHITEGSVEIFNTKNNECFSVICLPSSEQRIVILWCNIQTIEALGYFRDSFPSISLERLISYTKVLYFCFFQKIATFEKPLFISDSSFTKNQTEQLSFSLNEVNYHNSYYKEQLMLDALQKGILVEFRPRLADFIQSGTFGEMTVGNELRNSKNLLIAATTLFTRAAIKGGMHPESAYALSDRCVQRVERLQKIDSIVELMQEIGELFVKRIRAAQNFSDSTLIFLIQDYIFKHLNEHLELDKLASKLGYSKGYLCRVFKNSTNQTIIDYTNEQKIREIQSELVFSNKTITEIAVSLGFNDQSYLTKLFIKKVKTTPTAFRRKYHM
ncbi:MAG: AraC family transcriptional regulator [Liquorilactobacillus sp.]|uniref:helix-turn-helix domain-containing protein n=2 Tax=Liquorilactobacillus sp. TaxID=2767923 RepID=UPI0039E99B78